MAYSYSIDDPAKNSKRTLAFFLVLLIHAGFFWVLASGLGAKMVQTVMGPVETEIIEELPDDENEPPPPPPDIEQPPPYVPPPEVSVDIAIDTGPTTAISGATNVKPTTAPPPVAAPVQRAVVRTPPSAKGKGTRTPLPEYPPASRRAGEAGSVTISCLVGVDGRCTDVSVAKSSGFPKLDEAAVKEVQRTWKFAPAKEDGQPVATRHTFLVTFNLTD